MTTIRVLIVDDVSQVRQDLTTVLRLMSEEERVLRRPEDPRRIEIVGEAANGLEAVAMAETLQPEVVLMDLEMPAMDGYEAACQIKRRDPACRVIALTIHDYEAARQKALQAGVDTFIVKGAALESLVQAILARKE